MTSSALQLDTDGGTAVLVPAPQGGLTINGGVSRGYDVLAIEPMIGPRRTASTWYDADLIAGAGRWVDVKHATMGSYAKILAHGAATLHRNISVVGTGPEWVRFFPICDEHPIASGIGWPEVFERLRRAASVAAVDPAVLNAALRAAQYLALFVYIVPEVSDGSDGDLSLLWVHDDLEASLSFELDGSVAGYAFRRGEPGPWTFEGNHLDISALSSLVATLAGN